MPDIKIVTDVAARACALPLEAGAMVGDGNDLVFVDAMKMEIPVAASAALVAIDDVVTKDQLLAILQT